MTGNRSRERRRAAGRFRMDRASNSSDRYLIPHGNRGVKPRRALIEVGRWFSRDRQHAYGEWSTQLARDVISTSDGLCFKIPDRLFGNRRGVLRWPAPFCINRKQTTARFVWNPLRLRFCA